MKRCDGRKLKSLGSFVKIVPYIMERRSDAQVFAKQIIETDVIDSYISEKRKQGYKLNYMHLFISVYLRVIAERPKLNRFVMNNQFYARNGIFISLIVKRLLNDDGEETSIKFQFTGRENIFEVIDIVNSKISEASASDGDLEVDRIAAQLMSFPGVIKKIMVRILKAMDTNNMLPKSIIDNSPFHTTLFLTYLKSIKTNYIYHHLYDFGTTGIFAALGKTEKMPVVENDKIVVKNCCQIGYTFDERICDGLYLANSLKLFKKYMENPLLLEKGLIEKVEDVE